MRFIKYLSLEVVLGAVLYQYFIFDSYFNFFPSPSEGLLLALVVWLIYLLDRQLDNIFQPIQDNRHQFHQENRTTIWLIIACIGIGIALLLPFQSKEVLKAGLALFCIILAYSFVYHKGWLGFEKEILTAVLYGLGVGLVVWVRDPHSFLFVITLAALAYQNLCYFALIEKESLFYASRLKKIEWILMGLMSGIYASNKDLFSVLPFLVTFGWTFILSRSPLSEECRFWADLAFWSPLIYLIHGIFST